MRFLLQRCLAALARLVLWRRRPLIVAITGSVGKTSTREAIFSVLKSKYRVRRSEKNYNTEIGVPLAILGIPHYGRNIFKWPSALIRVAIRVFFRDQNFREILVLEMGADRPGDIAYLTRLAPPLVGVVTAIGQVPVHVEFFGGPKELALEKSALIAALPPEGYAVLNCDDDAVMAIASRTNAHILSYGFRGDAAVHVRNYALHGDGAPSGIRFEIEHGGAVAAVHLQNTFGKPQALAAAAAAAVGRALNMSLDEIARSLAHYESPPGRLKLLRGGKGTLILDDTYNASPAAALAALEVLEDVPAKRRIAVLGDMLELGAYTEIAHRRIGERVAGIADVFIGVGERMKFALDEARRIGRPIETYGYPTSSEAGAELEKLLQPGDVALVKGSQGVRMERVVLEVMAEPQRANELLVRQTVDWQKR